MAARSPPVTNHFSPLSNHPSPSRTAVASIPVTSDPAEFGSVMAQAVLVSPRITGSTYLSRCDGLASLSRTSRPPRSRDDAAEAVRRVSCDLLDRDVDEHGDLRPRLVRRALVPVRQRQLLASANAKILVLVEVQDAGLGDPLFERVHVLSEVSERLFTELLDLVRNLRREQQKSPYGRRPRTAEQR